MANGAKERSIHFAALPRLGRYSVFLAFSECSYNAGYSFTTELALMLRAPMDQVLLRNPWSLYFGAITASTTTLSGSTTGFPEACELYELFCSIGVW